MVSDESLNYRFEDGVPTPRLTTTQPSTERIRHTMIMHSKRKRTLVAGLAALGLFIATSAESCSTSLKKADQGLSSLEATCNDIASGNPSRADFAAAEAEDANISSQSLAQTKHDALKSLDRHCGSNQNPDYKPYSDVQLDLMS